MVSLSPLFNELKHYNGGQYWAPYRRWYIETITWKSLYCDRWVFAWVCLAEQYTSWNILYLLWLTSCAHNLFTLLALSVANQLLDDAETLYSDGSFSQHYFQFGGVLLKKPSVRILHRYIKKLLFPTNFRSFLHCCI